MAYVRWKAIKDVQVAFAGASHYVELTVSIDWNLTGLCRCKSTKGALVKVELGSILGKNRKPCGYHSAKEVAKEALERYGHQQHRCGDCLQQPPYVC